MSDPAIGDRITGRCVRTGDEYAGTIVAIYRPQSTSNYTEIRYRLCNTGYSYSDNGSFEPVITRSA